MLASMHVLLLCVAMLPSLGVQLVFVQDGRPLPEVGAGVTEEVEQENIVELQPLALLHCQNQA